MSSASAHGPTRTPITADDSIENLQSNKLLWYKIHIFLYDLRHFQEEASQARLDSVIDSSYLCSPYFTSEEVTQLKATKLQDTKSLGALIEETLNERLERRVKKQIESGDFRVCAAHDLAPIFERAFHIKPKDLERDRILLDLIKQSGLTPSEEELKLWQEVDKKRSKHARGNGKKKKT
ncbi:hypothetical protein DTO021D3_3626 [Paecilomyces variotii]|nr:hypothetical protein DTO032I3_3861 [Paecilomyces variotii]KAJ9279499.1 hypothetical protein DTO021D3_3626 [Paecilomyces variotii]KAJ9342803.1 hypothetical protein DTO027B6_4674 [Paecilomyces variotii]KAJ9384003.1 hypothetical protein DTO032I4_4876 [Paecilomyces variotii]